MLNIKLLLQKQIGNRIKFFRKNVKGLKQEDFSAQYQLDYGYMEVSILSFIERGKIKGRNTSYLTNAQLNDFSSMMGCTVKELVFGKESEMVNTVKLILLGIIMNGSRVYKEETLLNPIININEHIHDSEEFLRIAMLNVTDSTLLNEVSNAYFIINTKNKINNGKNLINDCKKWYEDNYDFFADPINYKYMDVLLCSDLKMEKASNLLINLLFSNIAFATDFITGIESISQWKNNHNEIIGKFRMNVGQFGGIAIDWKEVGYSKFVKAFNEMWSRNEDEFMNYFNKNIFNRVSTESSFKDFDENFFENVIVSSEFNDLIYTMLNNEKYNLETMVGHNIVLTTLQTIIIESAVNINDRFQDGYNIYKYNYDINQISQAYLNLNESDVNQNLFLYINEMVNMD